MVNVSEEIIKDALQGLVDEFLIPKFLSLGMKASGKWIESLSVAVEDGKGVVKGQNYSYWLVNGRDKNANQSPEAINHFTKWAGHFIFKKWVEDKGLNINPYAVARKVATKGTNYYPSGTDLLEVLNSREAKSYLYNKIAAGVSFNVNLEIKRIKKNIWQGQQR